MVLQYMIPRGVEGYHFSMHHWSQRLRRLPFHGRECEFDSRVVHFVLVWWNGRHMEAALDSISIKLPCLRNLLKF